MLNIESLKRAEAARAPFPYVIVPQFVEPSACADIEKDFPAITKPGSFPLDTLSYGPAFQKFMDALRADAFRDALAEKLGIDLSGRPTMITVRGQCRERDGQIHTDSKTKIVTVLIYMNGKWENPGGRLRLLNAPDNLDAVVAEVPPVEGTLLAFLNVPHAWHGHAPFAGPRRAIQLNWVTDKGVVWREQMRHKVSAFFKKLKAA